MTHKVDIILILILSTFGIVMGWLSVRGLTGRMEPYLWFLFGIITSLVLAKNIQHHLFVHAFTIGVLWGIINA